MEETNGSTRMNTNKTSNTAYVKLRIRLTKGGNLRRSVIVGFIKHVEFKVLVLTPALNWAVGKSCLECSGTEV